MREVKFRGRRLDTGEWVYGKLLNSNFSSFIVMMVNTIGGNVISSLAYHEVNQESTGQYTGLKDKNGVEIWDGDIVQFTNFDTSVGNREDREHIGIVKYQSGIYEIWKNIDSEYYGSDGAFILNFVWLQDNEFEVIGNIYQHPHLLEEPT